MDATPTDSPPLGPTRWLVLSAAAPPPGQELLFVEGLRTVGGRGVERHGSRYRVYIPDPGPPREVMAQARDVIRAAVGVRDPDLRWRWASPEEMTRLWGRDVRLRPVANRFLLVVSDPDADHDATAEVGATHRIPIRLRPGPAFGSGDHPTTRACLRLLEGVVEQGDHLLDVGTGAGTLALAGALIGADRVVALEAEGHTARAAVQNVRDNGLEERISVHHHRLSSEDPATSLLCPSSHPPLPGSSFHGILANLEPGILLPLLPRLAGLLSDRGWLLMSGLSREDREEVMTTAAAQGLRPEGQVMEEGWIAFLVRKQPKFNSTRGRGEPGSGA
jgi:ribosomal protein L11 methyltransferase